MQLDALIQPVATAMRRAADLAILPTYRNLGSNDIEEKSAGELVTRADREAEAILTPILGSLIEGARVVGEEAAASNPALLHGLEDGVVWLVDPLDGTSNFARGTDPFAVMVALLVDGDTVMSWILDPLTGAEYFARKSVGVQQNGRMMEPAPRPDVVGTASDRRGAILTRFLPPDIRERVERGRTLVGDTTSGMLCAGAEYPAIAQGQRDFALFWRTLPWDHAPGALFVTEAGGHVARPDGSAYRPGDGKSGLLVARNKACWIDVHRALLA